MGAAITNETILELFTLLDIPAAFTSTSLVALSAVNSRYIRDLKLNVSSVLTTPGLSRKEGFLLALSVAVNEKHSVLTTAFESLAGKEHATPEEIAETHACASIMSVNNVLYRFRHYMKESGYYSGQPSGLRMSMMMGPVMGKGLFELMSLVLSVVNGCEACVVAHEHAVKQHGADEARIYNAIRLAAVIKGLCIAM
jgi:alkyl hydroperoxide reductase subunit D